MGKLKREIKGHRNQEVQQFHHNEELDDSLLPDAQEIGRLREFDPSILEWLKSRAEKEQDFRHSAYNQRLILSDKVNKREHDSNRIGVFIYFIIVLVCLLCSFLLIWNDKKLEGSIFGGITVIFAFAVIITKKQEPQK
ncbi:MAG TPA: hypothetical protein DCQ29_02115 [Chitinophagaceae bacterium]|nr:hypothetical protein [Chitinophagaceae bacterium]